MNKQLKENDQKWPNDSKLTRQAAPETLPNTETASAAQVGCSALLGDVGAMFPLPKDFGCDGVIYKIVTIGGTECVQMTESAVKQFQQWQKRRTQTEHDEQTRQEMSASDALNRQAAGGCRESEERRSIALEENGEKEPNDLKLSDCGARRGSCVVRRSEDIRASVKGGSDETRPDKK